MASTLPAGRTALKRWIPRPVRRMASPAVDGARTLLFLLLERLVPADRATWCFCTWGNYGHTLDNPRAVFERVKDDPSIRKVVLTRGGGDFTHPLDGVNVHRVDAASLRGMWLVARSGVVVLGYSLHFMCSYARHLTAKHRIVQLSHGVALRNICRMVPGETWWAEETPLYAATIGSARRDPAIMRRAYAPVQRVWMTGLPRNDFILQPEAALPADYREMLRELRGRAGGRRMVLYAPTWRQKTQTQPAFSPREAAALEGLLRAHDAVLAIRGHSNVRHDAAYTRAFASPAFLSVNELPDVAVALRETAVLITDYSSIYIDFLLTGRPVIHYVYDRAAYEAERGFLYPLDEAFAGPAPETFAGLLASLEQALARPEAHREQRARAKALFHAHPGDSAQAVAAHIRALAAAPPAGPVRASAAASRQAGDAALRRSLKRSRAA